MIETPRGAAARLSGIPGLLTAARRAKATLDAARLTPGAQQVDRRYGAPLHLLSRAGRLLGQLAGAAGSNWAGGSDQARVEGSNGTRFEAEVRALPGYHSAAVAELREMLAGFAPWRPPSAAEAARLREALELLVAAAPEQWMTRRGAV